MGRTTAYTKGMNTHTLIQTVALALGAVAVYSAVFVLFDPVS